MTRRPTIEQVRDEPAGMQMDAWVAEYVMGLPNVHMCEGYLIHTQDSIQWNGAPVVDFYSTNITAAWRLVEKMQGFELEYEHGGFSRAEVHYAGDEWRNAWAETAPLAICRAALLAVLEEQP